jgi:hypothetical protein
MKISHFEPAGHTPHVGDIIRSLRELGWDEEHSDIQDYLKAASELLGTNITDIRELPNGAQYRLSNRLKAKCQDIQKRKYTAGKRT